MWPFPNPADLFGGASAALTGWAWDKVVQGIYTWFASGLLLLMEWVWSVLDTASTPALTDGWFTSGLVRPISGVAVAVTVAMMLASAVQAGFGGRPELIIDALKEGPKAIVATAITVVVMDVLVQGGDLLADVVWQAGRADAQRLLDDLAEIMATSPRLGQTFLGPLALLFGMVGLLVTSVVLFMRSALLYLVAAFSPIVWAGQVSPVLRGASRRLVQVAVGLVLAKPAITVTLVVGVKLVANTGGDPADPADGAAALGRLISGFACFAMAGLSPWVVYRLLPSVEQAAVGTGIVGGWGRGAMTGAQAAMLAKSMGATAAGSVATRAIATTPPPTPSSAGGQESSTPGTGVAATPLRPVRRPEPAEAAEPAAASISPDEDGGG